MHMKRMVLPVDSPKFFRYPFLDGIIVTNCKSVATREELFIDVLLSCMDIMFASYLVKAGSRLNF
jgi:hypothetical protein